MNRLYQVIIRRSGPAWRVFFAVLSILGLLTVFPGSARSGQETVKIAAIYAYSGPVAVANFSSVRGVRMAVEDVNRKGGLLGLRVELLEIDNLGTPIGSRKAALKAVQNNVAAIIGAAFSTHSIAVAAVAQEHGVPMITNISTNPRVTRIGDYIFRVCYNDRLQGEVMARFALEELHASTVVTVFDVNSDYSMGFSRTFDKAFSDGGGELLARLPYRTMQPNFRDLVGRVRTMQPDVLFVAGHGESARILLEAAGSGVTSVPLGGDGWDDESFPALGGDKIQLGYYATHWSPSIESEKSRQFVARCGDGGRIWAPTALGYDAVNLLADAIKRAGTIRRPEVRDALAATRDFRGVTGAIAFDAFGDPVKNVVIMKIQNGRRFYLKTVAPGRRIKAEALRFPN